MALEFLCHFDEADGSTTFTESSDNTYTSAVVGGIEATTTNPKWGTACCDIPGAYPERLTFTRTGFNAAFGGVWTVEFWIYITAYPTDVNGILWIPDLLKFYHNGSSSFQLYNWANNRLANFDETDIGLNEWHHIAFCADGDDSDYVKVFIDGAYVTQTTNATGLWGTVTITDLEVILGYDSTNPNSYESMPCKIDELRILSDTYIDFSSTDVPTDAYDANNTIKGLVDFEVTGNIEAEQEAVEINLSNLVDFEINGDITTFSALTVKLSGATIDFDTEGSFTIGHNLIHGLIDFDVSGSIEAITQTAINIEGEIDFITEGNISTNSPSLINLTSSIDFVVTGGVNFESDWAMYFSDNIDFKINGDIEFKNNLITDINGEVDFAIDGSIYLQGTSLCNASLLSYNKNLLC